MTEHKFHVGQYVKPSPEAWWASGKNPWRITAVKDYLNDAGYEVEEEDESLPSDDREFWCYESELEPTTEPAQTATERA